LTEKFAGLTDGAWEGIADRLTHVGVFADEERDFLSGQAVVSLLPQIEEKLRSVGYSGGPVDISLFDSPQEGATYLLFDRGRLGGPTAAQNAWRRDYEERWRARVRNRVADWLNRLATLRGTFEQWIQESEAEGIHIVDRQPAIMNEELMRRFGVNPAQMPVYDIVRNDVRLMRVQPKGLWTIGGNGRVDLVTRTASPILVDASQPQSDAPNWQIYQAHDRTRAVPFNRETFMGLLRQDAA
jgi:hypothetical protein